MGACAEKNTKKQASYAARNYYVEQSGCELFSSNCDASLMCYKYWSTDLSQMVEAEAILSQSLHQTRA